MTLFIVRKTKEVRPFNYPECLSLLFTELVLYVARKKRIQVQFCMKSPFEMSIHCNKMNPVI